jgi:hypothetical protein
MKENQHLGLWNNKYVKRLKNNTAGQSKPQAERVARDRSCRERKKEMRKNGIKIISTEKSESSWMCLVIQQQG